MNLPVLIPQFPSRPADLPSAATVDDLFDAYDLHLRAVIGLLALVTPCGAR